MRQAEHQWGAPPDRAGTILVADDDGAVRETLGEVLEMAGYEVRRAEDGNEALRVLADERVDLLILDIGLPNVDGWTVMRTIDGGRPQVIVHSGMDFSPRDIRELFQARPFAVLPKPVRPIRMLAAVEAALVAP